MSDLQHRQAGLSTHLFSQPFVEFDLLCGSSKGIFLCGSTPINSNIYGKVVRSPPVLCCVYLPDL